MGKRERKNPFDSDIPIEKQSEKQKWSNMEKEQKIQYITDYYLVKGIVLIAGILCIIFLIWSFLKPKEESLLYIAVIDKELEQTEKTQLKEKMSEIYGVDEERIQIDDSFYLASQGQQKLEVYLYNQQVDAIIASEDVFRQYAAFGFFDEMPKVLADSEQEKYKQDYQYAAGYEEKEEVSFEDNETGEREKLPYGIGLSSKENSLNLSLDGYVYAIVLNAPHKENAVKLLNCIIDE